MAHSIATALALGVIEVHGPRIAGVLGGLLIGGGALAMRSEFDRFGVSPSRLGLLLLGSGGPFVLAGALDAVLLARKHKSLAIAALYVATDASSSVFLYYRVLNDISPDVVTLNQFFKGYLVVPITILLVHGLIMPRSRPGVLPKVLLGIKRIKPMGSTREPPTETMSLLPHNDEEPIEHRSFKEDRSGIWGVLHRDCVKDQLTSLWFVLLLLFTAINLLRINYYIATVLNQAVSLLGSWKQGVRVNRLLDVTLPLGGLVVSPFMALMLRRLSNMKILTVIYVLSLIISLIQLTRSLVAQMISACLFGAYRSAFYIIVAEYVVNVFGYKNFSSVFGVLIAVSGLGTLLLIVFDHETFTRYHTNPTPVNFGLTVAVVVFGCALVIHTWLQGKKIQRKQLEEEAEQAPVLQMPGASHNTTCDDDANVRCDDCVCDL